MNRLLLAIAVFAAFLGWANWESADARAQKYAARHSESVILYATNWCGYCAKTRQFLTENRIPYFEYDIEESAEGHDQFKDLGGKGVPLVLVKGQPIFGYSPEAIKEKL